LSSQIVNRSAPCGWTPSKFSDPELYDIVTVRRLVYYVSTSHKDTKTVRVSFYLRVLLKAALNNPRLANLVALSFSKFKCLFKISIHKVHVHVPMRTPIGVMSAP
jgi:hypothetical protein